MLPHNARAGGQADGSLTKMCSTYTSTFLLFTAELCKHRSSERFSSDSVKYSQTLQWIFLVLLSAALCPLKGKKYKIQRTSGTQRLKDLNVVQPNRDSVCVCRTVTLNTVTLGLSELSEHSTFCHGHCLHNSLLRQRPTSHPTPSSSESQKRDFGKSGVKLCQPKSHIQKQSWFQQGH